MKTLFSNGLPYSKKDGECAHPSCLKFIDLRTEEKLPKLWSTVTFNRNSKNGGVTSQTFCLCPDHTISFVSRQETLKKRPLVTVILESPFAGDVDLNILYARFAMKDCLSRGEAPYASHLLYTQVLNDTIAEERTIGIEAGLAWAALAQKVVVYRDLGISPGMKIGIQRHQEGGKIIEYRNLPGWDGPQKFGEHHG